MAGRFVALIVAGLVASTGGWPARAASSSVSASQQALDVTGTWVGSIAFPQGSKPSQASPLRAALKQSGPNLTGSIGSSADDQLAIANGRVEVTQFGAAILFDMKGSDVVLRFELRPAGGLLRGVARIDGSPRTAPVELHLAQPTAPGATSTVTGRWIGTITVGAARHPALMVFTQSEGGVTGTVGPDMEHQAPIAKGRVAAADGGSTVSFEIESASDGTVLVFALKVSNTGLNGTVTVVANGQKTVGAVDLTPVT